MAARLGLGADPPAAPSGGRWAENGGKGEMRGFRARFWQLLRDGSHALTHG